MAPTGHVSKTAEIVAMMWYTEDVDISGMSIFMSMDQKTAPKRAPEGIKTANLWLLKFGRSATTLAIVACLNRVSKGKQMIQTE